MRCLHKYCSLCGKSVPVILGHSSSVSCYFIQMMCSPWNATNVCHYRYSINLYTLICTIRTEVNSTVRHWDHRQKLVLFILLLWIKKLYKYHFQMQLSNIIPGLHEDLIWMTGSQFWCYWILLLFQSDHRSLWGFFHNSLCFRRRFRTFPRQCLAGFIHFLLKQCPLGLTNTLVLVL